MKKCDRCEESPGTIVCNECATKEDPSPLLYCEACSQLVHIGRNSKHKVISTTSTKEKEETQKKHDKYKRDLRCAELKVEELKNIQDSMDEMLRIHERTIRTTVVTVQEQLKNKAMVNIKTLREQYGKKKEQLEHTASQARQQLDDFQQLSAKIEETLSKDDVAFAEASKDESCIIHQEWKAVGVSLDAPSVEVPFVFNASNLMAQIDLLTLELHKDAEDLGVAPPSPVTEEGVEMEVEVCCSLGKSGTFWVIPLFGEEVVLKLQRLSNTIRDTYIKDAEWVTYSEDSEGPSVADMVYAKSPKDSKWYRARVEETRISKKASKVTLVDYGSQEVVGFDHLLPWKTDLAPDWPHQAIECSLFDSELIVVGEPQWVFNDRIQAKKLMATFTQQLAQKAVWRVELLATDVMDNIVNVNDAVREKVKGFQDKPKIVCRDIRYVGLEDDGPSAAVSVPSPAAVMKEPEGATESTKAGEVVSVGLGEVDGAGEGTTGTATGADAERDSKSDAITASSCDALSAADKTDSRSDSTPEKTESVKDAGQVASPVGFGDSPLLTWVKASGCLSPSGDGEEEDVGDCGEDTGRCCEAKGDSGHVAASCVEDERRADEPERATQLGDHSYATAADEPSVKISSSAEADTLKRETDNNVEGSAVCVVSESANLDAQIRHEEAADSVNEVTLIKAASLEEPVVSEGKGQGKDSCERGEVPEAGTDSPTGEVLNLGAPGAGSEPGSQRGPCGPGDGSEPGSQRDPCGPGDGSEPGSQRDSCGPGDGSEPGSQRDSCGPGDGSEPGSQRDSCGPGDGSEPGSQRDSCGPGDGSEPGSQRDSCGPGDGSEPGIQRDSCGPGAGSEPGSQRDSCGPGDGSEPGSQRDSCGPGDGSDPGSQRDSCGPGDGSEPGSQRDSCGPGDGSEPGSQRDSCAPGDGSEPGSQRDPCGPGDGSEPGSQRDSFGPGDGSEPGSQRDSCGPGDGSEPGSQRDSCGPGDGSEPGSQRDSCGPGDGSEQGSQRDSCGPGAGSEPGSQRDSCGPGAGSEPGNQDDICSGEATDTSVSGKKDPDQLEAGTAPSVHLPLEQRQPKQPRRKMFSKTPENTSAGPSVTDREPCSSGNCTANDQPEEATSSDSLSQIDRDTTPLRSSGTLSNEVTTRLSKSLLYQECGMVQKTQTQATSVRDGSGKVHQQQTTVAPSRQSINYAQSGSEVSTQGSATSKGSLSSVSEDARSQSPQLVRSTESASTPSQEASAQSLVSTASGSTTVKSRFSRSVPSTGPPRVVGSQAPQPVPNEASPQGPPESSVSSDPAPNVVQSAPRTTCRDTAAAAGAKVIISRSQPTSTEPSTSGSTSESLVIKPKPPEATTQSPVSAASSERARNAKVDGALSTSAKPDAAHQRLQKRTKASASAGAVPKPRPGAPPGGTTETQGGGNPDIAQALASVPKATGSMFTGQVVSELSPEGCFWMQLDREAWADKAFQTLQTQLQDMVKLFMSVSIVKPKDLVLVPDEKKLWCRAQVKSVVGNKATVCLVDKGRVTVAPVSALREAPDKLWRIPFQSIYCGLQTSTCTHFSQAACAYFDKAIRAKHMGATTVRVTDDVTYVTLHDHESTNVNVKLYELSGISSMPAPMPSASPPLRYIGPGSPLPLCCTYLPVCTPVMQAPLPGVMAPMTCSALDGSGQAYGVDPATGRQCFLMTQGLQSDWTAMDQEVMSLASSTSSLPLLHYDQASGAVVYSTVGGVGPVEMVVTSGGGIVAAENYQPPVPRSPGSPLYQCDPPIGLTWQQQQIQQQQQQQQQQMQMQQQQQQQHQMQMQMQQQQMQMQQQQMQQQQQQQQQQQDQQAVFNEEAWQEDGSMVQEGAAGCTEVGQGRTRPGSGDTRTTSHVRKDSHDRDSQTHRSVGGQLSRRCFNCDEPGHVSRKCPKPQRTDMGSSAGGRSRRGPKTSGAGRSLKGRGRDVKFVPGTTDPSRLTSPEEW